MTDELLSIGIKIELTTKASRVLSDEAFKTTYISQILDMQNDIIIAAMPISEGHIIPLQIGSMYDAFFYTKVGMYKAECKIVSRDKEDNIYIMGIEITTRLERFQRREYYRLECSIEAEITVMTPLDVRHYASLHIMPEEMNNEKSTGIIVDISGGGCRFISKAKYAKNDDLCICFPLGWGPNLKDMVLAGKVVLCEQSLNNYEFYNTRVKFRDIPLETREQVVRYIFEQQRRIRQKERGEEVND